MIKFLRKLTRTDKKTKKSSRQTWHASAVEAFFFHSFPIKSCKDARFHSHLDNRRDVFSPLPLSLSLLFFFKPFLLFLLFFFLLFLLFLRFYHYFPENSLNFSSDDPSRFLFFWNKRRISR